MPRAKKQKTEVPPEDDEMSVDVPAPQKKSTWKKQLAIAAGTAGGIALSSFLIHGIAGAVNDPAVSQSVTDAIPAPVVAAGQMARDVVTAPLTRMVDYNFNVRDQDNVMRDNALGELAAGLQTTQQELLQTQQIAADQITATQQELAATQNQLMAAQNTLQTFQTGLRPSSVQRNPSIFQPAPQSRKRLNPFDQDVQFDDRYRKSARPNDAGVFGFPDVNFADFSSMEID